MAGISTLFSSSSQHPTDSSASSSPSSVLPQSNPTPLMPNNPPTHAFDLTLGDHGAIVSAAQSRVGSPVDGEEHTLFDKRVGLSLSMSLAIRGMGGFSDSDTSADELVGGDSEDVFKARKRMPANHHTPERRRRRRNTLNDKLFQLRSVVPNITKMDRVSVLGDAIEYMEELTRKINTLQNELNPIPSQVTSPTSSSVTHATSFSPLTPNAAPRTKKELFPVPLPSPNAQPTRIEVRMSGTRCMSIHVFCTKRPGLLLSISRALDSVGFEIQKAVMSSFNMFVMDIYRAEQCMEGRDVHPEEIKALLLEAVDFAV